MIELKTIFEKTPSLPALAMPQEQAADEPVNPDELLNWLSDNHDQIRKVIFKHGAILFRGWKFRDAATFQEVARIFLPHLARYSGGNSPRTNVHDSVYTSTEFAKDAKLSLHNEASYLRTMPSMIFFMCDIEPKDRGQTPLADCRNIYKKIRPDLMQKLIDKKIMYVNNLHGGYGFGKSWQQTFECEDKKTVEEKLTADGYDFEWKADGGLRTMIVCDAVRKHPVTGEDCWINQAEQWHYTALDESTRESLLELMGEDDLPHCVYYGDGSKIDVEDFTHIRAVMDEEERKFDWKHGDVLCCDNHLVCHGREPFTGERRILATMG